MKTRFTWALVLSLNSMMVLGINGSTVWAGQTALPAVAAMNLQQLLDAAEKAQTQNNQNTLRDIYTKIVSDFPDYEKIEEVQEKLGALNIALIFSRTATEQTVMHQVDIGDSLGKLAKQYGTTKELIKRSNGLKSDVIKVGQTLRIWKEPFTIFVDKSQNVLVLRSKEHIIKTYRCSTGKDNSTPTGTFTIGNKIEKPVWFKPGAAPIPAESPENELGARWMGFEEDSSYGIHGTIRPEQIGTQATAGCVRLKNEEVEELFDIIPVGTKITIQD